MRITVLDAATLGEDISLYSLEAVGDLTIYYNTKAEELADRIRDCEILITNKIKLNRSNLIYAKKLKLICVTATGYDNIDIEYCRENNIAVCNVVGYSTDSVAQITVTMALSLYSKLGEFNNFVKSGEYSESGVANRLSPVYRELRGKTWGIIGGGNIGMQVLRCAEAFGCKTLVFKKTPVAGLNCVDVDTLCRESDIISVHLPLSEETRNIIDEKRIKLMKNDVVFINVARGAVTDEKALAEAVKNGEIGAIGIDVYSVEPFGKEHPFYEIKDLPNVCLTPHMAWGSYEARCRCVDEIVMNIQAFMRDEKRNRVDL